MKCNQYRPGFELVSPCPFPTTITITPRAPPTYFNWCYILFSCFFVFETNYLSPVQRGLKPQSKKGCSGFSTNLHLLVRIHFRSFQKCRLCTHCYYSLVHSGECGELHHYQVHSDPKWLYQLDSPSMGKIHLLFDYFFTMTTYSLLVLFIIIKSFGVMVRHIKFERHGIVLRWFYLEQRKITAHCIYLIV